MKVKSYEELVVWQKAMLLAKMVYDVQKQLPNCNWQSRWVICACMKKCRL